MMKILKRIFPKNVFQSAGLSQASIDKLLKSSTLTTEEIFDSFSTSITGLDEDGVEKRRKEYGLNRLQREKAPSWVATCFSIYQSFYRHFNPNCHHFFYHRCLDSKTRE